MTKGDDFLTLRVGSLTEGISAQAVVDVFLDTLKILGQINRKASPYGSEGLEWRIVRLAMQSPLEAQLHGVSASDASAALGATVVNAFVSGIRHLATQDTCPRLFNKESLQLTAGLIKVFARGVSKIEFASNGNTAEATHSVSGHANAAIYRLEQDAAKRVGDYVEYGAIEGYLKAVAEQANRDQLVIADSLTGERTKCYFRNAEVEKKVRTAWKHRVRVVGETTVDSDTGDLKQMQVDDITILRSRDELPQIDDLAGIDITQGIESSEYVRDLRDAK